MGCALPGDSSFNNINNPHNKAAIEALKKEFKLMMTFDSRGDAMEAWVTIMLTGQR